MARVPYFDMSQAPAAYADMLAGRPPLNLYRMLPYAGKAAQGFLRLGGALLRENMLDAQLREIAILRVGMLCRASYEVHQHKRVARQVGLAEAKIAALEEGGDVSVFSADELAVLRFTDQLVQPVKAPDEMFQDMLSRLGAERLAELVLCIGFYMMVSRFLENFEVDIEAPGTIV